MMKGIYAHGAGFQAKFRRGPHNKVGTFATIEAAEAWMLKCLAAYKLGQAIPDPAEGTTKAGRTDTIRALAEQTDREFWTGNPDCRSASHLRRNAYLFAEWVGPNTPVAEALTKAKIEEYLIHRDKDLGNAGGTVNRHRASISKMCTNAASLVLIPGKPIIRKWPEGPGRERMYTDGEEMMILATVKGWGYHDYHALFTFLAETGCRLGETNKMPWAAWSGDLLNIPSHYKDEKTGRLRKLTKSGKARTIGLSDEAQAVLKNMKEKHGHLPGPFEWHRKTQLKTLWGRLRGHLPWLQDKDCVVHTFRHTFASRLVQETGNLDPVQRWLGHVDPKTTQRYARYAPKNIREVNDVMARRRTREMKEVFDGVSSEDCHGSGRDNLGP